MTRNARTALRMLGVVTLAATALVVPDSGGPIPAAHAIVGMPATPVSVAGVARRTTRRTVVATEAVVHSAPPPAQPAAPPPAAPPPAQVVAAPPQGCPKVTQGGSVAYSCAGTVYRPVYDGADVVYAVERAP